MHQPVRWFSGPLPRVLAALLVTLVARPAMQARQQPDQAASPPTSETGRTVRDGVYTSEQAMRGQAVAENHCFECHGERLQGIEGPELAGSAFLATWRPRTLDALLRKMVEMPKDRAETVTDRERVDALAYILQANGFPAGMTELPEDRAALARIAIGSAADSRAPGALVKATGCLTAAPGDQWLLTGPERFQLMNVFPRPTAHVGRTVVVTGFFTPGPAGDSLNVISIEGTGRACD